MAKVDISTDNSGSQLEGAAPFIGNADLSYQYKRNDFGLTGTIVCSYFSDRVYTIGTNGYNDIIEKGIPTLDIVLGGQINKHLSIYLKDDKGNADTATSVSLANSNTGARINGGEDINGEGYASVRIEAGNPERSSSVFGWTGYEI